MTTFHDDNATRIELSFRALDATGTSDYAQLESFTHGSDPILVELAEHEARNLAHALLDHWNPDHGVEREGLENVALELQQQIERWRVTPAHRSAAEIFGLVEAFTRRVYDYIGGVP